VQHEEKVDGRSASASASRVEVDAEQVAEHRASIERTDVGV
jgi:hypothetical protein